MAPTELPTELVGEIILHAWFTLPLFDPIARWSLFSRLSLVNRRFRGLALWVTTRHVRVLSHCSMDVAAYTSIGQQSLALHHRHAETTTPPASPEQLLESVFGNSTVYLDATYASYVAWHDGDRWLKDAVSPGRPDEVYGVHFDLFAGPFGQYTYPHPERREPEYREWLTRRKRDRLSGWFAELLAAVPSCAAVVVDADEEIEPLSAVAYAALLEAFWWWRSLERVSWRVVPGHPSFLAEMAGTSRGPCPPLPELKSVRRVWMSRYPRCTCRRVLEAPHDETCSVRRMLLPYPGARCVHIGEKFGRVEEIFAPPGAQVIVGTTAPVRLPRFTVLPEVSEAIFKFGSRVPPPRWVPWLNISSSDTLWEVVDPVSLLVVCHRPICLPVPPGRHSTYPR